MPYQQAPPDKEPTAELTSRTAVVAAVLVLGAIIAMLAVTQCRDDSTDPATDDAATTGWSLVTTDHGGPDF